MSYKSIKIAVSSEVLAAEYRAGATIRDIAKKYGCSFQNVNIRLINAGVAMRPTGTRRLADRICPTCGKTFRPYARDQRFCRMECIRKKAVCKRGHVLTEDNRYHFPSSASRCKQCACENNRARYARKQADRKG